MTGAWAVWRRCWAQTLRRLHATGEAGTESESTLARMSWSRATWQWHSSHQSSVHWQRIVMRRFGSHAQVVSVWCRDNHTHHMRNNTLSTHVCATKERTASVVQAHDPRLPSLDHSTREGWEDRLSTLTLRGVCGRWCGRWCGHHTWWRPLFGAVLVVRVGVCRAWLSSSEGRIERRRRREGRT